MIFNFMTYRSYFLLPKVSVRWKILYKVSTVSFLEWKILKIYSTYILGFHILQSFLNSKFKTPSFSTFLSIVTITIPYRPYLVALPLLEKAFHLLPEKYIPFSLSVSRTILQFQFSIYINIICYTFTRSVVINTNSKNLL